MADKSYTEALHDYREAYRTLYRPTEGTSVERGEGLVSAAALQSRSDDLVRRAEELGDTLLKASRSVSAR